MRILNPVSCYGRISAHSRERWIVDMLRRAGRSGSEALGRVEIVFTTDFVTRLSRDAPGDLVADFLDAVSRFSSARARSRKRKAPASL